LAIFELSNGNPAALGWARVEFAWLVGCRLAAKDVGMLIHFANCCDAWLPVYIHGYIYIDSFPFFRSCVCVVAR